ncbi:MAG: site-specific tyrosine recombinase XerD [Microbacteriaceae bacterium]
MTIQTAVDSYLRHVSLERGLAANTVAAYRRDLCVYSAWLADRVGPDPAGITRQHVVEFVRYLAADYPVGEAAADGAQGRLTASSLARMLSTVRGWHRFLLEEGIVSADVAHDIAPPKLGSRLPKAISIQQVNALLAATDGDDDRSIRDKALLELLYATGARVSEAVGLNVDDVIDAEMIRLMGKGGKQRMVPLGSYARRAIDAYLVRVRPKLSPRAKATPALFLGLRGQRVSRQNAWLIIRAAADKAKLGIDISPHTLRHSFATHLLAGGADVRVVQELLGHSSVATTQIYTLVTADTLRDMYTTAHPRARYPSAAADSEPDSAP